jgi:hypothetical protein
MVLHVSLFGVAQPNNLACSIGVSHVSHAADCPDQLSGIFSEGDKRDS